MKTIDIRSLIETGKNPDQDALKHSFGSKYYKQYITALQNSQQSLSENLMQLGWKFENNDELSFGMQSLYKPLLCYALAANLNDVRAYKAIILAVKKLLFHKEMYDPELLSILEVCQAKITEFKKKSSGSAEIDNKVQSDLDRLLVKVKDQDNVVLAERLDIAYEIYLKCNELSPDQQHNIQDIVAAKKIALMLMETILNTDDENTAVNLMKERAAHKKYEPGFIPRSHARKRLTKLPVALAAKNKVQYQWRRLSELALAHKEKKILVVNESGRTKDKTENTRYLTPGERDEHRVIIRSGEFYERQMDNSFTKCDTGHRFSHGKDGYVAFTHNLQGEISIFDHFETLDGYAHSSMNAGGPIFISGELKIDNGVLQAITVYSMHFRPKLSHLYQFLTFLQDEGVDISNITLKTWGKDEVAKGNEFTDYNAKKFYELWSMGDFDEQSVLQSSQPVFDEEFEADFPASFDSPAPTQTAEDDFEVDFAAHASPGFDDFEADFAANFPKNAAASTPIFSQPANTDETAEASDDIQHFRPAMKK
jgi:hypothetical protein